MIKSDFAKERFGIVARIAFAAFALWVLVVGATAGLIIDGDKTMVPGTSFIFAQLGLYLSAVTGVVFVTAAALGYKHFRTLSHLETEEEKR